MAAAYAIESLGLSERRACLLTGISHSVYRYKSKQGDDAVLRRRMRELAWERKRFGSPRLHIMLKREGLVINHKRTERIYSEEGLALRKKRRRKGAAGVRETIPSPVRPNQRWSMDFVSDSTVTGRRFRALAIVDDYSRECPAIEVDTSLGGARVVGVLERLEEARGLPEVITVDNGPEFAGKAMDEWACRRGIKLSFIPNPPMDGARTGEGGKGVTGAMIRARIRVDGRLAGGLQALLGAPMSACSGCGERDGRIGHGKRRSRTGMA